MALKPLFKLDVWKIGTRNFVNLQYFTCRRLFSQFVESESALVNRIKTLQSLKTDSNEVTRYYKTGKYMLFNHQSILLSKNNPSRPHAILWRSYEDVHKYVADISKQCLLLTVLEGTDMHFAARVLPEDKQALEDRFGGEFVTLRNSLFTLSSADSALVSQGWSLLSWGDSVKFCEACGGQLISTAAGTHKSCSACGVVRYPTLSPVGITLVTSEDHSKALLVRQHVHPPGMFTCIAGFIEVGESVEENVKREVAEEVGLEAKEIEYVSSQHWALPASRLMIGCIAVVTGTKTEQLTFHNRQLQEVFTNTGLLTVKKGKTFINVNARQYLTPIPTI